MHDQKLKKMLTKKIRILNMSLGVKTIGRKISILLLCIVVFTTLLHAQVGIDVASPSTSAVLDLNAPAKNKGLLVPKVNTTDWEGQITPVDGLLVYDENQKMFYHYDGTLSAWQAVNPFSYRKGSNAVDEDHFVIDIGKSVVIGTVALPTEKLEVGGNAVVSGSVTSSSVSTSTLAASTSITTPTLTAANAISTTNGNITAGGTGTFIGFGTIPMGGIIMWSGVTVPTGWALCTGATVNGQVTPDLRGRFIVGTGLATGPGAGPTTYALSDRGGSEAVAHTHSVDPPNTTTTNTAGSEGVAAVHEDDGWPGNHNHDVNIGAFTSGGASNTENRPPYFALAYIMRVQ